MAYKALYRIYRPQTFDEVVGQKYIVKTLQNAIKDNKIAHAYLFTGPRGTGKTTIAKLLAKAVNCTSTTKAHPCDECDNCKAIASGTHPDVIEIDAASNNGVDEVRELIEKVKFSPIQGQYKVYIIDEVHMMTSGAFNALLKTLEEPPAHVIFILATTDVFKVLPTIISRCQRFDFGKVSNSDIKLKLIEILQKENAKYEVEALDLIAELAEGGVRDALGILDQSLAYGDGNLTAQNVREIYGVVSNAEAISFVENINKKDTQTCLAKIDDFDKRGLDLSKFTTTLINILKETVIYKNTSDYHGQINHEQLLGLCRELDTQQIFHYIDILIETARNYRYVSTPRSYFELAVLKMCSVQEDAVKVEPKVEVKTVEQPKPEVKVEAPKISTPVVETPTEPEPQKQPEPTPVVEVKPEPVEVAQPKVEPAEIKPEAPKEEKPEEVKVSIQQNNGNLQLSITERVVKYDDSDVMNALVQSTKADKERVSKRWELLPQYVSNPKRAQAVMLIIDSKPYAASPNSIVIAFLSKSQMQQANKAENYHAVQAFLKELLGYDCVYFAMLDDDFKRYKLDYLSLKNSAKLPAPRPIENLKEVEVEVGIKPGVNKTPEPEAIAKKPEEDIAAYGKTLFGDLFKDEEK